MDINDIDIIIEGVIKELGYSNKEDISTKTMDRIRKSEEIIQKLILENKESIDNIKSNKLSISYFAEDNKIGIVRRSIYADKELLKYLEHRINNQEDYFNEKRIRELEEKNNILEEKYKRVLMNIVDIEELKIKCQWYEDEIIRLQEVKNNLLEMYMEKNNVNENLKSTSKSNKILRLDRI